jgi:predicted ATPase with chaperone activity
MELTEKMALSVEDEDVLAAITLEPEPDEAPEPGRHRASVPPPPDSLEEAGLSEEFVAGLVLKALHVRGTALGFDLFDMLALPMSLLDEVIQRLQEQRLVEVHATQGPRRGEWVFKLTGAGRTRASEELAMCRYVGPAPVPFEDFCKWVELQSVERARISEQDLRGAFEGIVVPDSMVEQLGPAINSGRSLFLFGDPGNGKTLLAERIARLFGDRYYVPFVVLVDGSVMVVHDPVHHHYEVPDETAADPSGGANGVPSEILRVLPEHDRRYMEARRPVVITGGELTLDQLDLRWDPMGRMYQAPPQLKAAGGVLVVDDLGRQRVPVRDLLNRWVVPLEHREDYLTLGTGRKIVVPFDCFVIFSTNLEPKALGDEAFLRRIHYKIEVPDPDRGEYEQIFRTCCEEREVRFEEDALDYLFDEFYGNGTIPPRRCHPRDVLDHLRDLAEYRREPARLSRELLEQACRSYFLPLG